MNQAILSQIQHFPWTGAIPNLWEVCSRGADPSRVRNSQQKCWRNIVRTGNSSTKSLADSKPPEATNDIRDNLSDMTFDRNVADRLVELANRNQEYIEDMEGQIMEEHVELARLYGEFHCLRTDLDADIRAAETGDINNSDQSPAELLAHISQQMNELRTLSSRIDLGQANIERLRDEHRRELSRIRAEESRLGAHGGPFADALQAARDQERQRRQEVDIINRRGETYYRFRLSDLH